MGRERGGAESIREKCRYKVVVVLNTFLVWQVYYETLFDSAVYRVEYTPFFTPYRFKVTSNHGPNIYKDNKP